MTYFTLYITQRIIDTMKLFGVKCVAECPVRRPNKNTCRADVGTLDHWFGFEIKNSREDMNSGYGLNLDGFVYSTLVVPKELRDYAFYFIYKKGFERAGIWTFDNHGNIKMIKPARPIYPADGHINPMDIHFKMITGDDLESELKYRLKIMNDEKGE